VRVELRAQVDVALRRRRAPEVLAQVLRIGRPVIEVAIMNVVSITLRKPSLLEEVSTAAEEGRGGHLAVDQLLRRERAIRRRTTLDVVEREVLLESLDRRVVAAGLVADRDRPRPFSWLGWTMPESGGTKHAAGRTE